MFRLFMIQGDCARVKGAVAPGMSRLRPDVTKRACCLRGKQGQANHHGAAYDRSGCIALLGRKEHGSQRKHAGCYAGRGEAQMMFSARQAPFTLAAAVAMALQPILLTLSKGPDAVTSSIAWALRASSQPHTAARTPLTLLLP